MFRGIVLAVVLMLSGDMALNEGQMTRAIHAKLNHFAAASSDAVQHSLFRI